MVDTPGLYDTTQDIKSTVLEMTRCLGLCCPGPHAVLFVVRIDVKFTQEEKSAFDKIVKAFGKKILDYMIVVFTHGEALQGMPIKRLLLQSESLKDVLKQVGQRYVVFSNMDEKREQETRDLLSKIDDIMQKTHDTTGRNYFTNDALEKFAKEINAKVEKLMEADRGLSRQAALSETRQRIVQSKETTPFILKLVGIAVCTAAFCTLVGLTGGAALGLSPLVVAGVAEGSTIGATVGAGSGVATAALVSMAMIVGKIKALVGADREDRPRRGEEPEQNQCTVS